MPRCCLVVCLALLVGCSITPRDAIPDADLLVARQEMLADLDAEMTRTMTALLARLHNEHERFVRGESTRPPTLDALIISGGGDWGAFGAGFLKGWSNVKGELARPRFDVVTGVSTGALIAPFAFLGTNDDIDKIVDLYRHPKRDWVKRRGMFFFLPHNQSFVTIPGLEHEMNEALTAGMIQRIAATAGDGRLLYVNTTNADLGIGRPFILVDAAVDAKNTGDSRRMFDILLASSAIPGAFPPRHIDGWLYVDGAVTGNILYGGRQTEEETIPARWQRAYPDVPVPRLRYWVIFNNQLLFPPQLTDQAWPALISRSQWMSNQSATVNAIRHLHAIADLARETHGAAVEVRIVAVPNDWKPPVPGTFVAETMNDLADIGERMGADPASWMTDVP